MKYLPFLVFCLFYLGHCFSQIIPEERLVDWSQAGFTPSIYEPSNTINIIDFGAFGNGTTDDSQAFLDAIESLNGLSGIIEIPAGEYLLSSPVSLYDSIILRGISAGEVILKFDLNGQAMHCLNISKAQPANFISVTATAPAGCNFVVVSEPLIFENYNYAEIRQDNGEWDTNPAAWAEKVVGQILKIELIRNDTLFFENALRICYSESLNPEIRPIVPITHAGIENLTITRQDNVEEGCSYNIYFGHAANCYVCGVESNHSVGSHIYLCNSTNISISGCYIHHAYEYTGTGSRGYGVSLNHHTGECLITNNIFKKLRHAMLLKTGANGNVISYNYSTEPYRSEPIHDYSGDISLHGHYAWANLFEGNIVQNIIVDHYWGPSGPYNTFFRNRADLYGLFFTTAGDLLSDQQNIVGNEITNTLFLHGLYILSGMNHYEYGNKVQGQLIPAGTNSLTTNSLYLSEPPPFWDILDPWPAIGDPLTTNLFNNPASDRFLSGQNFTVCGNNSLTKPDQNYNPDQLKLYPNPNMGIINLRCNQKNYNFKMINLAGHCVFESKNNNGSVDIPLVIPNGLYFVKVTFSDKYILRKIIIER